MHPTIAAGDIHSTPIPSEWTANGEPAFPPHINLAPLPHTIHTNGSQEFGNSDPPKLHPFGITRAGERYYSTNSKQNLAPRNMLAGYDLQGQPFYVPKMYVLPLPFGYTSDGIPFYDANSILCHSGIMVIPENIIVEDENLAEFWEDIPQRMGGNFRILEMQRLERLFYNKLLESLMSSQPELVKVISARKDYESNSSSISFPTPTFAEILKGRAEPMQKSTSGFRVVIEPAFIEFISAKLPTKKRILVRFKSARGDRAERDIFISTSPRSIFSTPITTFKLAGEGAQTVDVTFNPQMCKGRHIQGELIIADRTGNRISSCVLDAVKDFIFTVSSKTLDMGWTMIERTKEKHVTIANNSASSLFLTVNLKSDIGNADQKTPGISSFKIESRTIRIGPYDKHILPVAFHPSSLGVFKDTLSIFGSVGDAYSVALSGVAGMPFSVFPEAADTTATGISQIVNERREFIYKFQRNADRPQVDGGWMSKSDVAVFQNLTASQEGAASRNTTHTLEYGICRDSEISVNRYITLLNFGNQPISFSLFSNSRCVIVPKLLRVAGKSANSFPVELLINKNNESVRGNFKTTIMLSCAEFESVPFNITAYTGQGIYFPVWKNVFFKPCSKVGEKQQVIIPLVNESQYDVKTCSLSLDMDNYTCFSSNMPLQSSRKLLSIPAYGMVPITFTFNALDAGIFSRLLEIIIVKPETLQSFSALEFNQRPANVRLCGMCIDSTRKPIECYEFCIDWISHIDSVDDIYSKKVFTLGAEVTPITGFNVTFKNDPYVSDVKSCSFLI